MKNNIITVKYAGSISVTITLESNESTMGILEQVFGMFNHGSNQECPEFIERKMRSLSANDFVRVNGKWFQCANVGWKPVTNAFVDKIESLVVNHPKFREHGDWVAIDKVMYALRYKQRYSHENY